MTSTSFVLEGRIDAPVLVVANSLGANHLMWEPQMAMWKKHFLVLRYNYRGHGDTPANGDVASTQDLAQDAIALVDHLGISSFSWLGLSLGGMLGLYMAARYPNRVNSLVSACFRPHQTDETRAQWATRIQTVREKGLGSIVDGTVDRWLTEGFRKSHPQVDQALRKMVGANHADGYMACGKAVMDYDSRPYIHQVVCPVLLISGAHDMGAPTAEVANLNQVLVNSRHEVLPAAHIANQECPEKFQELSTEFVLQHGK